MSDSFIKINTLSVSKNLADFVKNELLTGLDVNEKDFCCLLYTSPSPRDP